MPEIALAATTAEAAGTLLVQFIGFCTYGFYLFSGIALLFGANKLQQGDFPGFVKSAMGAGFLFLAPTFISEISSMFEL